MQAKYRIRIAPINILRYKNLEITHKNSLNQWLEVQKRMKDATLEGFGLA